MPTKETLYRKFKDKGLMIIAVSFQEPEDLVRDFQKKFKLSFPVLFDPEGKVTDKYQFRGHPLTFLIDRNGFFVGKVVGERNWSSSEGEELVSDLLNNP